MKKHPGGRPHGQIRQSQLVTSFGPGSIMDLPNHSVIIGGLETWSYGGDEIFEPRLVDKLKTLFDPPLNTLRLYPPPPDLDDPTAPQTGITAWQFPEWFITQDVDMKQDKGLVRSRMLVHRKRLTKGKFIDDDRKKRSVVPIRFVRACRKGHIGDIDWYTFAHSDKTECRRQMWLDEHGTSGDINEVYVRCECGKRRPLAEAVGYDSTALGYCDGNRPWLGPYSKETCTEMNRLLIRQASNAYFSQRMSVISLPDRNEDVRDAVQSVWDFVSEIDEAGEVKYERKKAKVQTVLEGFTDYEVFEEIKVRRGQSAEKGKSVKQAELETLIASKDEIGEDRPDGDFFSRNLPRDTWDKSWMKDIERVVLVHRLREVIAQVGFTRFEAISPDIDGELEIGVQRSMLAREISWLPAVENRGEGVFIQFSKEAIDNWCSRTDVVRRNLQLERGFRIWGEDHKSSKRPYPGLPYLLLHSFSHLMVTAVALECGYPASSIRERIYAIPDAGYGVLLYTATSDAEGTLGGLVQVGKQIHEHVRNALEMGELCSNDPVCAQHDPADQHERRFLHGAACHGCLLISETSCEQHNEFLDRALVVPTVDNLGVEFFSGG
ncbi:MAG: DUF1998 domain-containing protein [Planctomycetaceae bacterium]|nr:DUF1998 domain-containing protein [Planctomycetaceae bacterium]